MPNTVTLTQAKERLEDLVAAAERNEEWLIVNSDGKPVAKLAVHPVEAGIDSGPNKGHISLFGLMKGQIELRPGWDDPLEDFKPYME